MLLTFHESSSNEASWYCSTDPFSTRCTGRGETWRGGEKEGERKEARRGVEDRGEERIEEGRSRKQRRGGGAGSWGLCLLRGERRRGIEIEGGRAKR
eukprot:760394-Hanusia_phi.AAC.1